MREIKTKECETVQTQKEFQKQIDENAALEAQIAKMRQAIALDQQQKVQLQRDCDELANQKEKALTKFHDVSCTAPHS